MATSENRKRTAGRPPKYTFDVAAIAAAMSNVSGDRNSYRASKSLWGKILIKIGMKNKLLARRNLYLRWRENRNGMQSAIKVCKGYLISCIDHLFDSKRFMNFVRFENYLKVVL